MHKKKKKKKYERKYYLFSFRKNLEIALVGHVKSKKSIHTWNRVWFWIETFTGRVHVKRK